MGKEVGRTCVRMWGRCGQGQDVGKEVGRTQAWVRRVGSEQGHGHAGGQDAGEDMGMSEDVGRMWGWVRRLGGEGGCKCASGFDVGKEVDRTLQDTGEEVGITWAKMWAEHV